MRIQLKRAAAGLLSIVFLAACMLLGAARARAGCNYGSHFGNGNNFQCGIVDVCGTYGGQGLTLPVWCIQRICSASAFDVVNGCFPGNLYGCSATGCYLWFAGCTGCGTGIVGL